MLGENRDFETSDVIHIKQVKGPLTKALVEIFNNPLASRTRVYVAIEGRRKAMVLGKVRTYLFAYLFALSACIGVASAPSANAADIAVENIRIGVHPAYTRFVVDISQNVKPRIFTLSEPYRVVIDLPEVEWGLDKLAGSENTGFVTGVRFGQFKPGNSRIVIDVAEPVVVDKILHLEPNGSKPSRLVVDLKPTTEASFLQTAGWPAKPFVPSVSGAQGQSAPPPRWTIVLDPGHGGKDSGAIGVSGVYEKSIALKAARELKSQLDAKGRYDVILTRNEDIYHPLRKRVDIARAASADLFISLHADSNPQKSVHGASVYTLSEEASDDESAALAQKENRADIIAGVDISSESSDVSMILIELSQRETKNRSVLFAQTLTPELAKNVGLLRKTHRFAGFVVLKAPDVPSVLVELGYLSNRKDEKLLRSDSERSKVTQSVASAVDKFFVTNQGGGQTFAANQRIGSN